MAAGCAARAGRGEPRAAGSERRAPSRHAPARAGRRRPRRRLMRFVSAAEIDRVLNYPDLSRRCAPPSGRHHGAAPPPPHDPAAGRDATLILMPAWHDGAGAAMPASRSSRSFPDNAARGKPSVMGTYLLLAGDSGEPLAAFDGQALTLWRTAAASALAASYLARARRPHARHDRRRRAGAAAHRGPRGGAADRGGGRSGTARRRRRRRSPRALDRPGLAVRAVRRSRGARSPQPTSSRRRRCRPSRSSAAPG